MSSSPVTVASGNGHAPAVLSHGRTKDSEIAISVRDLAKSYTIVHEERQDSLLRATANRLRNPLKRPEKETFWALNGVSFDVKRGEVVGIIGRNGAGKSTLLKVLSRITEPTRGEAILHGRLGSLLEVGTGFHPELTGRENVYLNGAVLGMSRAEIDRQFDAIVDFSGTEKFLDTPVKRYSSGMYVRLAFAVAAHLEPEILIVDEVLAVGDAAFQKKCLGKMKDVAATGRTVLFVSHAMASVQQLCSRCIFLSGGSLVADGSTNEVIELYTADAKRPNASVIWSEEAAPGNEEVRILGVKVLNKLGEITGSITLSEPFSFEIDFLVREENLHLNPHIHLANARGDLIFTTSNRSDEKWGSHHYSPGQYRACVEVPANLLNTGDYFAEAILTKDMNNVIARVEAAVAVEVMEDGSGRGGYSGVWGGFVRPLLPWCIEASNI